MDEKMQRLINKILVIFHIELSDNRMATLLQFIKFSMVGISNTLISYVLYVLVLLAMHPFKVSWDFVLGNTIAFILSVLWSFYWNNRFVFTMKDRTNRKLGRTLIRTYISYGFTGIFLNNLLSWLWVSVIGVSKYIAPLINLLISVPLNFIINKFWAFNE